MHSRTPRQQMTLHCSPPPNPLVPSCGVCDWRDQRMDQYACTSDVQRPNGRGFWGSVFRLKIQSKSLCSLISIVRHLVATDLLLAMATFRPVRNCCEARATMQANQGRRVGAGVGVARCKPSSYRALAAPAWLCTGSELAAYSSISVVASLRLVKRCLPGQTRL
jgi:hypothetical protein